MRVDFLGMPIDSLDLADTLQRVDEFVSSGKPHQILVANTNKFWMMRHDPRMAAITRKADLVVPERVLVMSAALARVPLKSDVCGVALAKALLPHCEKRGHSIFFLGARPEVLTSMLEKVQRDYPALKIVGFHHGYVKPEETAALLDRIRLAKPDVILVAMGSPRQEFWISDHAQEIGVPVLLGVGGTFDVIAGLKKDAPMWIRKSGVEWFYRLAQDPKNLWKRYSVTIPWFLSILLMESVFGMKPRRDAN